MIVLRGHPFEWEVLGPSAVTIGVFDGVHLGHRRVIADLIARCGEATPIAVTFDPHPLSVIAPERAPLMLTDVEQRIEQFRILGLEVAAILHFPDIRLLSAEEFARRVLADALQAEKVVVGADFRFGHDRQGDADYLARSGAELGFEVDTVDMYGNLDGVVSSTRIRQTLLEGNVEEAAQMLTRPFELNGVVVEGDRRGRTIGFPTANLEVAPDRLVPGNGVYAARARFGDHDRAAVVNIGIRPTFDGSKVRIEAHLLDWEGDLYGSRLALQFISRIRGEKRFSSVEALKEQIGADVVRAGEVLDT